MPTYRTRRYQPMGEDAGGGDGLADSIVQSIVASALQRRAEQQRMADEQMQMEGALGAVPPEQRQAMFGDVPPSALPIFAHAGILDDLMRGNEAVRLRKEKADEEAAQRQQELAIREPLAKMEDEAGEGVVAQFLRSGGAMKELPSLWNAQTRKEDLIEKQRAHRTMEALYRDREARLATMGEAANEIKAERNQITREGQSASAEARREKDITTRRDRLTAGYQRLMDLANRARVEQREAEEQAARLPSFDHSAHLAALKERADDLDATVKEQEDAIKALGTEEAAPQKAAGGKGGTPDRVDRYIAFVKNKTGKVLSREEAEADLAR